jgi:hypothetical protein
MWRGRLAREKVGSKNKVESKRVGVPSRPFLFVIPSAARDLQSAANSYNPSSINSART